MPYSKNILIKQDEKSLTVKKIDNLLTNKITWKGNKQDLENERYLTIYKNNCFLIILILLRELIYKF